MARKDPLRATAAKVFFVTRLNLKDVMTIMLKSNIKILAARVKDETGEERAQIDWSMQNVYRPVPRMSDMGTP